MQLGQIVSALGCEVLSGQQRLDLEVTNGFAADLMSDVLAFAERGGLLITGLPSAQSVHTAEIADMDAVLLVGEKRPTEEAVVIARRRDLPLLVTACGMFEACGVLYQHGLRSRHGSRGAAFPAE